MEETVFRDELSADALEVKEILNVVQPLIINFINDAAESSITTPGRGPVAPSNCYSARLEPPNADRILEDLSPVFPASGNGKQGLIETVKNILKYSINTWDQGFLDKLYAATNAVGVASEIILAVLNTNVHIYKVSPALTVIEKSVSRELASLFGLNGIDAGGLTQPGGSMANLTALVAARNTMFPETKIQGINGMKLVLFTSSHGHYSLEKAAQVCGLGSRAVRSVPVDAKGRMLVKELEHEIELARKEGLIPFMVNATSGTTVYGSFDPLEGIGSVCKRENLWFHVDASWGGGVVFSSTHKSRMKGSELANSITFSPHKMLHVPLQCSFILFADLMTLWKSNTLPAGYLFHNEDDLNGQANNKGVNSSLWDLGDLSLQCGRRGDALKFALGLKYYGVDGYGSLIDGAFSTATYLTALVEQNDHLMLLIKNPTCLQVCFYFAPEGELGTEKENSERTSRIAHELLQRGFMIDYAPGDRGMFFRVVVSIAAQRSTMEKLVDAVVETGTALFLSPRER